VGETQARRSTRATRSSVALLLVALTIAACGDGEPAETDVVDTADAITAIIAWQADGQEPVLDDQGDPQQPVIFVVPADGATLDVGVQADVTGATVDWATVRFADDVADTFDPAIEGEPVRENGSMLMIGPIPESARSIEVDVVRYTSATDAEALTLEITSDASTADGDDPTTLPASVTAVMRP
jgi:hypothetical protein